MTLTLAQSTVVVERSKPSQGRSFLTTDLSQFGHADDECQRGALTNARDAQHQVKPAGKIVVATKKLGNGTYLSLPSCLQPSDVAADKASQPRFIDMLEPGLEAREVLLDLLEKGEISSQIGQSWIRRDPRRTHRRRARRDQDRIKRVVLGMAQMHPAKSFDLHRLQHQDHEARCPQMLHHAAFVAAGCLDTDASDAGLGQVGDEQAPARQSVGDLPAFSSTVNCDVEFRFGCIDSSRRYVSLRHLPRPLPCEANQVVPATIRVR